MVFATAGPYSNGPGGVAEDGEYLRQRGRQAAGLPIQLRLVPLLPVKPRGH